MSFSQDEPIEIDDEPVIIQPKTNLNNVFIDLTNTPEIEVNNNDMGSMMEGKTCSSKSTIRAGTSQGKEKISKTSLALSLAENETTINTPLTLNQPGPSRRDLRKPANEPCYKKLVDMMNNKPLIENYEDFICILCHKLIKKGHGVVLKECIHSFCKKCLTQVILNNPIEKYGRVDCPHNPDKCENQISNEEIKAILGDKYNSFVENNANSTAALLPTLLAMDDVGIFPNYQSFECQVCFMEIGIGEGIILKNCLHNGCKDCLAQHIMHAEEFEVQCPHVENNIGCDKLIQEMEMRYLISKEMFEKHLKKSLKIAEYVNELNFHCRGLDCENFVELEPQITSFICQVCRAINCVPCKAVHTGKSCQEYQEDTNPDIKNARLNNENKMSEETIGAEIAAGKAMKCPRCSIPVMKVTGCDFITCSACKLGICWITRKPRNNFKRATGEVVEGCKCKENGKPCHPKCGNCH